MGSVAQGFENRCSTSPESLSYLRYIPPTWAGHHSTVTNTPQLVSAKGRCEMTSETKISPQLSTCPLEVISWTLKDNSLSTAPSPRRKLWAAKLAALSVPVQDATNAPLLLYNILSSILVLSLPLMIFYCNKTLCFY